MSKIETVPQALTRMHPEIPPRSWERLSGARWRAPHANPGFNVCVVMAFGQTMSQGVAAEREDDLWPKLFEACARIASQREACANGTPVVRPDDEANIGVVGRCWWCGKWPREHTAKTVVPAEAPPTTVADHVRRLNGPMVARLRKCAADTSPNWEGQVTIYPPEARDLVALIDGAAGKTPAPEPADNDGNSGPEWLQSGRQVDDETERAYHAALAEQQSRGERP